MRVWQEGKESARGAVLGAPLDRCPARAHARPMGTTTAFGWAFLAGFAIGVAPLVRYWYRKRRR